MPRVQASAPLPQRSRPPVDKGMDARLRYGGPWFRAASALPLGDEGVIRSGRFTMLITTALRRPRLILRFVALLLRTRTDYVLLSRSVTGRALRDYFDQRSFGVLPKNRLCRGVLIVPRHHSEYLRGRRRQALRTNLRRAATAGIRCETLTDRSRVLDQLLEVERRRQGSLSDRHSDDLRAIVARPELEFMIAQDESGLPLAIAGVVIDATVCLIRFAVATSHEARWALHDHLVRTLIARGGTYLLAKGGGPFGALGFSTNVQHYQHLLGYELRHIRPVPASWPTTPSSGAMRRLSALPTNLARYAPRAGPG